jgi:hypothetical protein
VITVASYHDRTTAEKVMAQLPHSYTFGDKGYVNRLLQEKLMSDIALPFGLRFAKIIVFPVQKMETMDMPKTQNRGNLFCSTN